MSRRRPRLALTLTLAPLLLACLASAQTRTYRSPAGGWEALVIPAEALGEPGPAMVRLRGPAGLELRYDVEGAAAPVEGALFDDGTLVLVDDLRSVGRGEVLWCHGPEGARRWSWTLAELLPEELLARVPGSGGRRAWRAGAPRPEGGELVLPLWNADELRVELAEGRARHVEVADHGEDAAAWAASGRDRLIRGQFESGTEELETSLALDPTQLVLWNELANAWRRERQPERALAVLERGVAANPAPEEQLYPLDPRTRNVWLLVQLALAYQEVGRAEEARAAARRALAVEPTSWPAASLVARQLAAAGELEALDALLRRTFEALEAPKGGRAYEQRILRAALLTGGMAQELGRLELARELLTPAVEGPYSETLHLTLADVHEALGEPAKAQERLARVLEELLRQQLQQEGEAAERTGARIADLERRIAALE